MAITDLNLPKRRYMKTDAHWAKRILAFLIDIMIISFLTLPLQSAIPVPQNMSFTDIIKTMFGSPEMQGKLFMIELFSAIIAMLYFIIIEYKLGQSIGKTIMGLKIESEDKNHKELTLWQMFLRNLFFVPLIPFNLLAVIDPVFMIFRKDRKRFSDMFSKTKVVEYVPLN